MHGKATKVERSQMMQVTVKTLRHYEQKGLLLPDEVDEWTGYRYYSIGQMQKLKDIRDLQRLGFSLDEIKELYEEDSHTPNIRQHRTCYIDGPWNQEDPEKWLSVIQIPIE